MTVCIIFVLNKYKNNTHRNNWFKTIIKNKKITQHFRLQLELGYDSITIVGMHYVPKLHLERSESMKNKQLIELLIKLFIAYAPVVQILVVHLIK